MKKRLLSILFTLALCLALLSVTALAADTITVNGVDATNPAAEPKPLAKAKSATMQKPTPLLSTAA